MMGSTNILISFMKAGKRYSLRLLVACFLVLGLLLTAIQPAQAAIPTFSIVSVVTDTSVTIQAFNFPAGQTFTVRMGAYGTLGIGGVVIATTNSGAGGSFLATYSIPDSLKGYDRIAIRMDSPAGYYAYNWFWNNTATVPAGSSSSGTGVIPTFTITQVVKDTSVTIRTSNFPAGRDFTVRMGPYGTLAIGGTVVATTNSGAGGSFEATYSIPAALAGSYRIAIRMDSADGYFAYNWFYNNTVSVVPGYSGIPTFSILSVVRDDKVTIRTNNFPAGLDFTVRMGAYGTQGVGGTVVATTNSGAGGTFDATYSIPDGLKGSSRIAIRLESAAGYYAYNWFWNNTTDGSTPSATPVPTVVPGYSGIPTFSIVSVVRDSTVTIQTYNLPPDQEFTVRMGPYGTLGIGGIVVGTFNSGAGGSQSQTWSIPGALAGSTKIAIRMDSNLGYYAFNWFWNNTTS